MSEHDIAERLRRMSRQHILEVVVSRAKQFFMLVEKEGFKEIMKSLKNEGFAHLSAITAVKSESEIELLYHLVKEGGIMLTVRTRVYSDKATIPTMTDIIPGASLYEREIHDLFGVTFEGHPNLAPLIVPDYQPERIFPQRNKQVSETGSAGKKQKNSHEDT